MESEAEKYKGKILECIDILQGSGEPSIEVKAAFDRLREHAKGISDPNSLFLMYQSLRESVTKLHNEVSEEKIESTFKVKMPDGKVKEFTSLEEAREEIPKYYEGNRDNPKA